MTGAGGFIGGHLVADLRRQGYEKIRAVDVKPLEEWYQRSAGVENLSLDLNLKENCETVCKGAGEVEIDIWGTGHQTRSFMYIDDCVEGVQKIHHSDILEPINLGSSELVSINRLVDSAEDIGGVKLKRTYDLGAPKGVAGRNSDNTLIQRYLHWEPGTRLRDGLEKTYAWIYDQYVAWQRAGMPASAGH